MEGLLKKATIDFKNKVPRAVGKKLPEMRNQGEIANKKGDYEKAFIFFKRWLNVVEWIKTSKPYREDAQYYNKSFSIDKESEVKALFLEVEAKVKASLVPPRIEPEVEEKVQQKNKNPTIEGVLNLPETPTDEPLAEESKEFTTCLQLFEILKTHPRPLIIDVRPKEDYMESRIKSNRCINIPADKIRLGVLASSFEKLFVGDRNSRYLFENRRYQMTEMIILLDWSTTSLTLFPDNKMRVLKQILDDWDPGTTPPKITFLDGGYADWLNRYPSLVTNPNARVPEVQADAMDEILEDVTYPEWLNSDEKSSPFSQLRITPIEKNETKNKINNYRSQDVLANRLGDDDQSLTIKNKSIINSNGNSYVNKSYRHDVNNDLETKEPYKLVNKKISELSKYNNRGNDRLIEDMSVDDEDESIFDFPKASKDITTLNNLRPKPKVDRSSKPSNVTKTSSLADKLLTLKTQLNDLLKNLMHTEEEISWLEKEIYEHDENDNRTLSGKAKRIGLEDRMNTLNLAVTNLKKQKDQVKEALASQSMKNVLLTAVETKKNDDLDLSIGGFEQRLKSISLKREMLKEKIISKEKAKMNSHKMDESEITKEPLKSDGSSANTGLKRSYSSPNLGQLDDVKIPVVDRSSKPRVPAPSASNRPTISMSSKLTWKDREQRLEPVFRDTRPGITGLKNLGNSCYMNSIIQCLSNNIRLAKYFNEDAYLDDLNKNLCKQGQVADEVANVIKALWRGQYKSISPRDLKVVIGQYRLQFDCNDQQDSHEFLVFLLDWLHNDLKKAVDGYLGGISAAKKLWFKSLNNGESIISELFMGQLKSSIICSNCNHSSITYETFNSLTLSLPSTNRCTLDDCIKKFVSGQKVSGWTCENCKVPRDATKKFDFIKLPPTVVIHLNRFADNEGWLQKSNTTVDFPLADFNLATYLVDDESNDDWDLQYDFHRMSLYAVSVHYGTMSGGHYTAYCRNGGQQKWYKYDDVIVSEVSPGEVKNQGASAYLLFYTTIGREAYPYIQRGPTMKLGRL